jgi:hypothetical protein
VEKIKTAQLRWFEHVKMTDNKLTMQSGRQKAGGKGKIGNNLDTGYSSNNERTKIGGWSLERQRRMKSCNKFLKWVQEDV